MLTGPYRPALAPLTQPALQRLLSSYSLLTVMVLAALYLTLMFNASLFQALYQAHEATVLKQAVFMVSSAIIVFLIALMVISLLAFRPLFKAWLILLLLSGSMASYFTTHYHIILDRSMVDNIMQTDWDETRELLSPAQLIYWIATGLLPSALVVLVRIRYPRPLIHLGLQASTFVIGIPLILGVAFTQYQDFASVFRNNRELRYLLVPSGYLYALSTYGVQKLGHKHQEITHLGQDAHQGSLWQQSTRKNLLILVVGETARAQNFSLGGYARNTNPKLAQDDVIYFSNVHSCGTSTAISVPCMFSPFGRDNYDESRIRYSDNLLDVLHYAGVDVLWRDNNSGCKGVCDRIAYDDLRSVTDPQLCNDHECFDMVLMDHLEKRIDQLQNGGVIVLHQKGSHGPGYFLRTPKEFKRFTPECHSVELQQCSQAEIQNAYDNTILYTDHLLDQLISFLKTHEDQYNGALMYVSDHGESLSEGNVYLHGLPYRIAPEEQTHVPLLLWLSKHYAMQMGIDQDCLRRHTDAPFSHDNMFDTVLDLVNVDTSIHHTEKSMVSDCMAPTTRTVKNGDTTIDDARQT